jgi:hypothetical protein
MIPREIIYLPQKLKIYILVRKTAEPGMDPGKPCPILGRPRPGEFFPAFPPLRETETLV